jgi:hypothetical protein
MELGARARRELPTFINDIITAPDSGAPMAFALALIEVDVIILLCFV